MKIINKVINKVNGHGGLWPLISYGIGRFYFVKLLRRFVGRNFERKIIEKSGINALADLNMENASLELKNNGVYTGLTLSAAVLSSLIIAAKKLKKLSLIKKT